VPPVRGADLRGARSDYASRLTRIRPKNYTSAQREAKVGGCGLKDGLLAQPASRSISRGRCKKQCPYRHRLGVDLQIPIFQILYIGTGLCQIISRFPSVSLKKAEAPTDS
jgi:hypothetical protein